ncbi:MAG TPA: peptide-modifying radical SAM enzyme CbpB [Candidatus Sulfotelmatobacter sp.]|nr:peptide-modifying radical SAM enzyme CbpB [Candidatus Sulfotelmatobacter sp.]
MASKGIAPASSRGLHFNTGNGFTLQPLHIGHPDYLGLVDPDTAFWALVRKDRLAHALTDGTLLQQYRRKAAAFAKEMERLRFGLTPSAVYFNPTDRCNLNCSYCYIPERMRRRGTHMSKDDLLAALGILRRYFRKTLPAGVKPQIVFHGAEPTMNLEALRAGIERFQDDFRFGIQTNGILLKDADLEFLTARGAAIGLSLDADIESVAARTRKSWAGRSRFSKVLDAMEKLRGYPNYSVICTVTRHNLRRLERIVEFFHQRGVPTCMLNPVRCTRAGARAVKPADHEMSRHYLAALDRTHALYRQTGRKLVVANFANVLIAILAPQARRLMCDISPCGGGRCFFAVSAQGDLFPCSEFIGLPEFRGGNLFRGGVDAALKSPAFRAVTRRRVEDIEPCRRCAVRHFCGAPCPAEAHEMNGGMNRPGAFCELYEEQVRYALRLIANGRQDEYLWDGWDAGAVTTMRLEKA